MILQALYEYYQRKPNLAPQGFERKEIPFLIVIDKEGNFVNLEDTRTGEGKNKRANSFLVVKSKGRPGKNSWQTANVFWDHYGYVLNYPKDNNTKAIKDARNQHETFVSLVKEISGKYTENSQFNAVLSFYNTDEQINKLFAHNSWKDCSKIRGCNLSFRIAGETKIVAEHEDLKNILSADNSSDISETSEIKNLKGVCLITGENEPIAILHTATSVPGGKSGGKLVGFQKNSGYDSYFKEQGLNAPISRKAENAYTTALNVLLGKDSKNKFRISDTTFLFWAQKEISFENRFPFFFAAPPKDDADKNAQEIRALFESVQTGKINNDGDTPFFILGLAPNAARISVRYWKTGKVKDFADKIVQHFTDLEMIPTKNDTHEYFSLFNLLTQIVFENKLENLPPNLSGDIMKSIIDGTPYPTTLQQQCIRRIRADRHVNRIRAAILKAYLNRKNRISTTKKQITMALDKENTNQGYLCGRLFAILEKAQEEALPGINAPIRDRYYGAASSTPVTVFGRLLNLTNHHLAKLNPGRKTNLEKLIQEIVAGLSSSGMPAHLSLDDQSRFAIGYYHQRQDLFTKHETN